jgi:glycerol uptake facilitator-like aquaporin/protein-tyrosine-phosphatase
MADDDGAKVDDNMRHRALTGEFFGTALLLAAVVGSGIMGERLANGNVAIALLANSLATGAALVALILAFGPISGAHFNPAVSLADASQGGLSWRQAGAYVVVQIVGAVAGVALADAMFAEPVFAWSQHARSGFPQILSEMVATFGLLSVIWGCGRQKPDAVPFAVAAYIVAAYWFTASTSFANPAVTLARALTDTFAGIRPSDVPGFWLGQAMGAVAATALFRWLVPSLAASADRVVVSHPRERATHGRADERTGDRTMTDRRFNVLFLCTGNSARSIIAEALLNHWGRGRFRAFSAGSHPKGEVHPLALEVLRRNHVPLETARSKSWEEFSAPDAPPLHFVFTVCDRAANEVCPVWPGQPMTAHWGIHDPAAVEGSDDDKARAFNKAFRELDARLKIFTSLRLDMLDRLALKRELDAIGSVDPAEN